MDKLRGRALIAYPTDSGCALACAPGNKEADRTALGIRQLDSKHNFTFVCASFSPSRSDGDRREQRLRLIKRLTPPWTHPKHPRTRPG